MPSELERYLALWRRRLCAAFVEQWGVCEAGHVLTPLNTDGRGRCWVCTAGFEREFDRKETASG